jgi:hypothetical protein
MFGEAFDASGFSIGKCLMSVVFSYRPTACRLRAAHLARHGKIQQKVVGPAGLEPAT